MYQAIENQISELAQQAINISKSRKEALTHIADTLARHEKKPIELIFICTHNSRRSIFAETWASVLADYYKLPIKAYSGGTETTAVHENALACLEELGFVILRSSNQPNAKVQIKYGEQQQINCFSKIYDDDENPQQDFLAIMLCDEAAENCPFIPNARQRINLTFPDPKQFDDTRLQELKYKEIGLQIGAEINYLFKHFISA